ncbi:hypothetical protein [Hymenobacter sp. YC55]|uniref:hypothetical protein n=1 Tax=Hymenobacter sp. YC55 TaxID=3034019 RepID=UPI0023F65AE0|nr:hypothetical protein [Hymenobacter sp. YC55]MDF7812842.1 hypothetical protein [Hymenobacter sp. YC55]
MKIYELPETRVNLVTIPPISFIEGEFVRIEMGFLEYDLRQAVAKCILKNAVQAKIRPVRPLQTQNLFRFFKPWKVADYFRAVGLTDEQAQNFFAIENKHNESIKIDSVLQELRFQQKQVVFLYAMSCNSAPIFIHTSGFYASVLALAYDVIKRHVMRGGTCIELAYPLFQHEDSLRTAIVEDPRTITLR